LDQQSILAHTQAVVRDLQETPALFQPYRFAERVQAQDLLEFHVLDALAAMEAETTAQDRVEYERVRREADDLLSRLEHVNSELLDEIRSSIRSGRRTGEALWETLENCLGPLRGAGFEISSGYDEVDDFVNRLLHVETAVTPAETRLRDGEMVAYQPTPARVLFQLLEWVAVKPGDVFYDLGSGLGRVAIMTKLLTGATVKGIEFEPTYCSYARQCARELNLQDIVFVNEDARQSDYSDGTVFYLYTPFRGHLLQEVLDRLRAESRLRQITVCTYGPCTLEVDNADWLTTIKLHKDWQSGLGVFEANP
jgi:hypothetical protein